MKTSHSTPNNLRTLDFEFDVPTELIAVAPRPHAEHRLLVFDKKSGRIGHYRFDEIADLLPPQSLIVVNNSRVMKTSLALDTDTCADIQVLNPKSDSLEMVVVLCPSPMQVGARLAIAGGQFVVTGIPAAGKNIRIGGLRAEDPSIQSLPVFLEKYAQVALPRYLSSQRIPARVGESAFQTIFARVPGSLTCPTAGLHFTPALVENLAAAGHELVEISLHIGFGSWGSLETEYVRDFDLDAEQITVSREVLHCLREARRKGRRILAVGTTSVRTLESISEEILGATEPSVDVHRLTNLLIYPGHELKVADMLLTDFAFPRTPVMMMSAAFCGLDALTMIYQEAVRSEYKFDLFGDGLLLL
ncbi:MAG: S-adenosylmethionine:tRNA ribosyltransferase-isomerase [Anaerolineales bacterium]|nr:S-adenosylmethionine:tRNA ribosyltransferase-isomerase [Anaerolineales bacterium]